MIASLERTTRETRVAITMKHPGEGRFEVLMERSFLTHMLEALCLNCRMDLSGSAEGDTHVDMHHLTEDLGIVMGQCLLRIWPTEPRRRYGWCVLPMDESLVRAAVDLSGRPGAYFSGELRHGLIGTFDSELTFEFFRALATEARLTLHLDVLKCSNLHHGVEGCFKCVGRALGEALKPGGPMSTKGVMEV
ncbi:imidazoleglycerol-phosphate dehydratase [Thermanaerovibrio velox DSM 12556]|uniref:Imidazoleglycerol-phosphate dehydratase n=1 Tax=Thermanaerovibrio velox DSM 12556 TaxID=926567 RepID=H0UQ51_9BACT|nr:imidazoleglycerol-phosphate dehydratase [Thermanaerovibrio velox]EHM10689.1 imidazoleglycerol-phosphate dehydratase [Thermanaerovibrio velox DSM 12556]